MSDVIEIIQPVTPEVIEVVTEGPQGPPGDSSAAPQWEAVQGKPATFPSLTTMIADFVAGVAAALGNTNVGGVLSGDLLAPGFAVNMATQGELDAVDTRLEAVEGALPGKADLVDGKLSPEQVPAVAITDTFVVNSQAAMLACGAERGDVAVRTDLNKSFILVTEPATTLGNWQELLTPASPVQTVAGRTGNVVLAKGDVGLGNVDNTSDLDKPVSTAQQTALDAKASAAALTAHTGNTANPHAVTKAQVGLGNVDNTSDANKPISTATQTALDAKGPLSPGWNEQVGTTYTLVAGDAAKTVRCTNVAAIALTIPTNATVPFPVGTIIELCQGGAGKITVGGAGVTVECSATNKRTTGQHQGATLKKRDTDTWWLVGGLE